jgi:hypothetical protein
MDKSAVVVYLGLVGVGLAAGAGTGFFAASPAGGQAAGQEVVSALEAQTSQDLELLQVERQKGMFQVDVKTQDDRVQTYYTSSTGELFFTESSATSPGTVKEVARRRRRLGDCLRRKQATLYGNLSQRATQLQVRALGQSNLEGVYADVNNASVLRGAVQRGVGRTPTLLYNGSELSGVNTLNRIASFTGCKLDGAQ